MWQQTEIDAEADDGAVELGDAEGGEWCITTNLKSPTPAAMILRLRQMSLSFMVVEAAGAATVATERLVGRQRAQESAVLTDAEATQPVWS